MFTAGGTLGFNIWMAGYYSGRMEFDLNFGVELRWKFYSIKEIK